MTTSGNRFYVYEHWRLDRDECFYVGKGRGYRAYDMKGGRNRHHRAITAKVGREGFAIEVRIVASSLNEEDAFRLEIERIAFWRSSGIDLANASDGGDCGRTGVKSSPETCARISRAAKGRKTFLGKKHKPESIEKMRKASTGRVGYWLGKKRSQNVIDALREANTGRTGYWTGRSRDAETIEKIKKAKKGCSAPPLSPLMEKTRADNMRKAASARKKQVICLTDGKTYESASAAASAYDLSISGVSYVCLKKRSSANGLVFKYSGG